MNGFHWRKIKETDIHSNLDKQEIYTEERTLSAHSATNLRSMNAIRNFWIFFSFFFNNSYDWLCSMVGRSTVAFIFFFKFSDLLRKSVAKWSSMQYTMNVCAFNKMPCAAHTLQHYQMAQIVIAATADQWHCRCCMECVVRLSCAEKAYIIEYFLPAISSIGCIYQIQPIQVLLRLLLVWKPYSICTLRFILRTVDVSNCVCAITHDHWGN